jgi:hypothetical protein
MMKKEKKKKRHLLFERMAVTWTGLHTGVNLAQ